MSVCQIRFVDSELKRRRKFVFYEEVTPYSSGWWCNVEINITRQIEPTV